MTRLIRLPLLAALVLATACATTGVTLGSGVGDTFPEHAPWYAGRSMAELGRDSTVIGHLALAVQPRAAAPAGFDPPAAAGSALDQLLASMNAYLDGLGVTRPLPASGAAVRGVPPDVRFGCVPEHGAPGNDCAPRGDSALGRGHQAMQLSVGRPSRDWVASVRPLLSGAGAGRVLVVTLEVGDYLVRQEGLAGTKMVELGTSHRVNLPWLTSLETPVSVLQVTAALVDSSGRALRIGAEGILARRTRLLVSAMGGQELLTEEDVRKAMVARRDDLPGRPLAWEVALRELVTRVTGRAAAP